MPFRPNITRITIAKNKFKYVYIKNKKEITNEQVLEYIYSLKIPPIWIDVLISDDSKSKIAVTGFDTAKRRQYIYTTTHNEHVRKKKYKNLMDLAKKINVINRDLNKYLKTDKKTKEKIIATIIKIIIGCNFRIGTEKGTEKYKSTGITTLKKQHIKLLKTHINIKFIGKKGVLNECNINRKGETLELTNSIIDIYDNTKNNNNYVFLYDNERINFLEINNFLKKYGEITSKSFRTFNANVILLQYLPYYFDEKIITKRKKILSTLIKLIVAPHLHHTPSISKKSYLLSELLDLFLNNPQKLKSIIQPDKEYLYKTKPRLEILNNHKKGIGKVIPRNIAIKYFLKILSWFISTKQLTKTMIRLTKN